jgi:dihydrofolate reductase
MRKIIVGAQVSMDGVMQAPGGPTEDPTKRFKFGGWVMPYFDQEFGEELDRLLSEKFDLLLGRKTYEIFAAYWPYYDEDAPHGGIAKLFKEIKKYAVSRSGGVDTNWQGSVLLRDIADVKTWPKRACVRSHGLVLRCVAVDERSCYDSVRALGEVRICELARGLPACCTLRRSGTGKRPGE